MPTLTITQGFSGSGKSTWADKEILASKGKIVGVNRDMLRMMTGRRWFPADEGLVTDVAREAIKAAFCRHKDVIADDTFINMGHVQEMRLLAEAHGYDFTIKSFLHVPLHECIKRDAARERSVGKDVIEQQYAKYWAQQPKPANTGQPAVIVDVDGTLAHTDVPYPAAYDRDYSKDSVDQTVRVLSNSLRGAGNNVLIMSGRDETHYDATEAWLKRHGVLFDALFMRKEGDQRDDATVKKELYLEYIQGHHYIMLCIDDRPRVVRMWRHELGLKVLHVTDNWEF